MACRNLSSGSLGLAIVFILAAFTSVAGFSGVDAAEIGKSAKIVNTVTGSQGNRRLKVPDPVFSGENVSAQSNSHGELRLSDNSRIIVGPGSTVSLDDFVVGGRGFTDSTIKLTKGAMRFISGNSKKSAYRIETPNATIGVRGTALDIYMRGGSGADVVLYRGEIEVCAGGDCVVTNGVCDIVSVASGGSGVAEGGYLLAPGSDGASQQNDFGLAFNQGRFPPGWRVSVMPCRSRAFIDRIRGGIQPFKPLRNQKPISEGEGLPSKTEGFRSQSEPDFTGKPDFGEPDEEPDEPGEGPTEPDEGYDPYGDGCGGCESTGD